MNKIAPYAKALIGAVVAGLASAQQALDDGVISPAEGVGIAGAVFAGLVLVFSVPNKDSGAEPEPADDGLSYEEAGGLPYDEDAPESRP
jgi:hypothetical protein